MYVQVTALVTGAIKSILKTVLVLGIVIVNLYKVVQIYDGTFSHTRTCNLRPLSPFLF